MIFHKDAKVKNFVASRLCTITTFKLFLPNEIF